jgi:alpha-tubulin suppressor-like RCC1 family protein
VTAVAAGISHSLALKSNGTVVAWGCGAPSDAGQCTVPNASPA